MYTHRHKEYIALKIATNQRNIAIPDLPITLSAYKTHTTAVARHCSGTGIMISLQVHCEKSNNHVSSWGGKEGQGIE